MNLKRKFPSAKTNVSLQVCCMLLFTAIANANDESALFVSVVDHSFQAEFDGTNQKYVVMTPQSFMADQPVSVLIALHGHGSDRWQFVRQPRDECRATRDVAAVNGMLLVSPDYRATTSWMGPAAEADLVQVIEILRQHFKVRQIVICGGSMGGTSALTFSALHPESVDGVVSLNGTANLVEYDGFQDAIAASFGGSKQEVPNEFRKRSAEFFPEKFTMPVAATTGGKDDVVSSASVLRLLEECGKRNRNVLSVHRPDGGHSTNYEDTRKALSFVIAACDAGRPRSESVD